MRWVTPVKWISVAVIVLAFFLAAGALPVGHAVERMKGWIEGLGVWGPVVFALMYVIATIFMLPGLALTLAAGAIFGLLWGTVTVSIGATLGAAATFLIGRYLARDRVERQAAQSPRFAAIDRAIEQGGWKIVAMLRLSPLVPFNLQNYFYGITGIRFWTCILTSWLFMLPGTFMYVYFGYLARESAAAAAGLEDSATVRKWALLGVGLLLAVIVTVYVSRLASRELRKQTSIEQANRSNSQDELDRGPRSSRAAIVLAIIAVLSLLGALYARGNADSIKQRITGLFGPPAVTLLESYEVKPEGPSFDHSEFAAVLKSHVTDEGWVDYEALKADPAPLNSYIESLASAPFEKLGRDEKLALLINAYNAFTLRLILDHFPVDSIKDIDEPDRWLAQRWNIGGTSFSLDQIEHEQIRPHFKEPRIHFALVCAAIGCPILRNEAYTADRLDEQLEDQMRYCHSRPRWFRYDEAEITVHLTELYKWYGGDFEQVVESRDVLDYVARYSSPLRAALDAGTRAKIKWIDYDWSLNGMKNVSR